MRGKRAWHIHPGRLATPAPRARAPAPDPPAGLWVIRWLITGYHYGFCERGHCWRLPYTAGDGRRWRDYHYIRPQVKVVEQGGGWRHEPASGRWVREPVTRVRYITYVLRRGGQPVRFSRRQLKAAQLLGRNPAYVPP